MEDKQKKNDKMLISLLAGWVRLMKKSPFLVKAVIVSMHQYLIILAPELPIQLCSVCCLYFSVRMAALGKKKQTKKNLTQKILILKDYNSGKRFAFLVSLMCR